MKRQEINFLPTTLKKNAKLAKNVPSVPHVASKRKRSNVKGYSCYTVVVYQYEGQKFALWRLTMWYNGINSAICSAGQQ